MPFQLSSKEKKEFVTLMNSYKNIFESRITWGSRGIDYRESEEYIRAETNIKYANRVLLILENPQKYSLLIKQNPNPFWLGYKALAEIVPTLENNMDEKTLELLNIDVLDKVAQGAWNKNMAIQAKRYMSGGMAAAAA